MGQDTSAGCVQQDTSAGYIEQGTSAGCMQQNTSAGCIQKERQGKSSRRKHTIIDEWESQKTVQQTRGKEMSENCYGPQDGKERH